VLGGMADEAMSPIYVWGDTRNHGGDGGKDL